MFRCESQMFKDLRSRRRRPEAVQSDYHSLIACPAVPTHRRGCLNGDALCNSSREDALLIRLRLAGKQVPTRHANDAGLYSMVLQSLPRHYAKTHFRASADEDDIRHTTVGFGENIGASRNSRIFRVAAIELRNGLTRQRHQRGAVMLNSECPGLRGFGRVGGADNRQARYRTEAGQLLNWLVRGAILPESNAVMRKYVNRFETAQRPQPDGRFHVIGKRQKCRTEGQHTTMCGHSIHCGPHGVFANTESNISAGITPFAANRA